MKWPGALAEMLDAAIDALTDARVPQETAERHARLIMLALAEYHGGHRWYLPNGDALRRALRDDLIWRSIGRIHAEELAMRHGITLRRLYQIIQEQRALRRKI